MYRSSKKKVRPAGLSPGTLHQNEVKPSKVEMSLLEYDETHIEERTLDSIEECFASRDTALTTWINIDGTNQIDLIEKLGKHYGLHPLLLEDIVVADQRPKLDDYGDHLFIILKMLEYDEKNACIKSEQVSIVLGKNYVISFQEFDKKGDVFNPNRERIRGSKGKIRKTGADYLMYSLIDTIVDHYFLILEKVGERIEELESKLITDPTQERLKELYKLKREIITLRKSVWPLREVISRMERRDSPLISPEVIVYIKDVYDHTIQIIDTIESYRDLLAGMIDIYMSSVSNKMNQVMKVLTVISSIFIPLTFIAGVYGMNFEFMPELHWRYGYLYVWILMLVGAAGMIVLFKKKKWI